MNAAKNRAIRNARRSPDLVVWESPDKTECQTLCDYKPSPGPGWVKVWPLDEEAEPSLADLYERLTTLTKQTTEIAELGTKLTKRVVALEERM